MKMTVEELIEGIKEVDDKLRIIEQVSLENDDYNTLYIELGKLRGQITAVVRMQMRIDKKEARCHGSY